MFLTAFSNPSRSSRMTSVSRTSISVREKLPATSFVAIFSLARFRCQTYRYTLDGLTYGFPQSGPFPEHESGVSFDVVSKVCSAGISTELTSSKGNARANINAMEKHVALEHYRMSCSCRTHGTIDRGLFRCMHEMRMRDTGKGVRTARTGWPTFCGYPNCREVGDSELRERTSSARDAGRREQQ